MAAPDDAIAVEIDGAPWVGRKLDAMRAHATQITPDGAVLRRRADPRATPCGRTSTTGWLLASPIPSRTGWADDVFAGLD